MNFIKTNILVVFLLIFLINIDFIDSLIVIPFKLNTIREIKLNSDYNATDFVKEYFYRDLYTNIITGIPSKSILAILDTRSHILHFGENFLNKQSLEEIADPNSLSKDTYDYTKSLSFKNISKYDYSNMELKSAMKCSETFQLYEDLSMKKTTPIQNIQFVIDDDHQEDLHIRVGLSKPLTKEYQGPPHLIQSLLDVGAIKEQSWTIKFLSKTEGLFILGEEPHQYQDVSKDKRYQRKYYFKTNSLSGIEYYNPISFSAQKVYINSNSTGEVLINENKGCYLNYNYGFIIGTKEYREYIKKNFFDELIESKICSYDLVSFTDVNELDAKYYVISCEKYKFNDSDKKYYENFPNLTFFVFDYNYNFNLTKEDLFVEINDKYYFLIIFEKTLFDHSDLAFWNLGLPFLQKYEFVHNYEKQNIGFYIPQEEKKEVAPKKEVPIENEKDNDNSKANKNENESTYKLIIAAGIIIGIILIIGAFCLGKYLYQSRKRKANELNDDFDYESGDKNKKTSKEKNEDEKLIN